MQASRFECLSFDPFPLFLNSFVPTDVDVRRRDVVQALMVAPIIVMIDKGFNLGFEITWHEVVFGPVAVWCRSFNSILCNKGDELWDEHGQTSFVKMRCGSH